MALIEIKEHEAQFILWVYFTQKYTLALKDLFTGLFSIKSYVKYQKLVLLSQLTKDGLLHIPQC